MAEPAEDVIVQNLLEALAQLREDLDKVELWTAALSSFKSPVPDYQAGSRYLLPPSPRHPAPIRRS